jgi:hypothetical protein
MNEWAAREGRASFSDRTRVSALVPDPFAHPVVRLLGYAWRLGLVVLLGAGVYWYLFRSHLAGEAFAKRFAALAQSALGAETAQISQLEWHGSQASAHTFSATGGPGSFFRTLEASEVSFHVPFSMYWEPEWRLDRVEATSVQVEFRSGGLNVAKPAEEPDLDPVPEAFSPPVLTTPGENLKLDATAPDPSLTPEAKGRDKRVLDLDLRKDGMDIAPAIRSLSLGGLAATRFSAGWGMTETTRGELRDASLWTGRERDGAWLIEIPSGTLNQNWLRGLKLTNLRARFADGVLALENTPVQIGEVAATLGGRIRCAEVPVFELTLQAENLPLETFCGDPFDRFFNLQASGTLNIGGSTNLSSGITVAGTLQATGGSIRGLPIQQALSSATTRIRFREFDITSGTIEFATGGGRLEVKSFTLASRTDVALRGKFTHDASGFAGELEIGADPALLQKLTPAVQDRFFPKSEGGKRWLTTPLEGAEYDRLTSALAREFTAAHEAAGKP